MPSRRASVALIPSQSKRELKQHQADCLSNYCTQFDHLAILFEQRLGKSLTTIRYFQTKGPGPILIVAPGTVLGGWAEELRTEGEPYIFAAGVKLEKRLSAVKWALTGQDQRRWVLINYESLRATPLISKLKWHGVVSDESVVISNPKAQITKVMIKGFRDADHRVVLTGLLTPEGEHQAFAPMTFLWSSFMGFDNYWKWLDYYFEPDWSGYGLKIKSQHTGAIRSAVHSLSCIVRRKDVSMGGVDVYERRIVQMNKAQEKLYKEVEKTWNALGDSGGFETDTNHAVVVSNWLRTIAGGFDPHTKEMISSTLLDDVVEYIQGSLRNEKILLWFSFRWELDAAVKRFNKLKIGNVVIHGGVPLPQRNEALRQFKHNDNIRILIATEQCAKYGINASVAGTVGYYSNTWSCNDRSQSKDRGVSMDKKSDNLIIDWASKGTVAEDVIDAVNGKVEDAVHFMQLLRKIRKDKENGEKL